MWVRLGVAPDLISSIGVVSPDPPPISLLFFLTVPPNGLVVYCGTIVTEEGKEKKVNIDFEPFKPINTSLYLCDNKFHTEVRSVCLFVYLMY